MPSNLDVKSSNSLLCCKGSQKAPSCAPLVAYYGNRLMKVLAPLSRFILRLTESVMERLKRLHSRMKLVAYLPDHFLLKSTASWFKKSQLPRLKPNPSWAGLQIFSRKGWQGLPFDAFAEPVAADIADIVIEVRLPDWQQTTQCDRPVQKGPSCNLPKYRLGTDVEPFDKAYA